MYGTTQKKTIVIVKNTYFIVHTYVRKNKTLCFIHDFKDVYILNRLFERFGIYIKNYKWS